MSRAQRRALSIRQQFFPGFAVGVSKGLELVPARRVARPPVDSVLFGLFGLGGERQALEQAQPYHQQD